MVLCWYETNADEWVIQSSGIFQSHHISNIEYSSLCLLLVTCSYQRSLSFRLGPLSNWVRQWIAQIYHISWFMKCKWNVWKSSTERRRYPTGINHRHLWWRSQQARNNPDNRFGTSLFPFHSFEKQIQKCNNDISISSAAWPMTQRTEWGHPLNWFPFAPNVRMAIIVVMHFSQLKTR